MLASLALLTAGCGDPDGSGPGEGLPEIALEEELRLGALEEPVEEVFGQVSGVAMGEDGDLWVLDGQIPGVRHFAADGTPMGIIGREGEGPGEFLRPMGIVPAVGGGFAVWDPRNARLSVFDGDGEYREGHVVPSGLFTANTLSRDGSGRYWVLASDISANREPGDPIEHLWIRLMDDGRIADSVPVPPEEPEGISFVIQTSQGPLRPFVVQTHSAPAHDGGVLVSRSDEYVVRRIGTDGVEDTIVARDWERLRVAGVEREQWQGWIDSFQERVPELDTSAGLPERKPVHHLFFTDSDGRIWIRMHVEAELVDDPVDPATLPPEAPPPLNLREPSVFHVWGPDGTPMGVVRSPVTGAVLAARGDRVWVLSQGEMGEPRLIRYRMTPAS